MIDGKTSGLFRMASRLMRAEATKNQNFEIEDLLTLMGRFFQIRDDYQNLCSTKYAADKGSFSDLDEGKYSFMLIHALNSKEAGQLKSILQMRARQGTLSTEQKAMIMAALARSKSMEYTLNALEDLQVKVEERLCEIECGLDDEKNWMFRAIMARLKVSDPTLHYLKV
ncbi:hypothetical protein TWF694_005744 [Orbilia ellipsospora]|uniref:Geranylgeranyl pyrophosphate synthase n=1 Tax=Orbilia ellipsospora TaxID=2528407 RepID=A0AAV9WSV5_9PEZI